MKRDVTRLVLKPDLDGLTPPIPLSVLELGAKVLICSSGSRAALFRKLVPAATVVTDIVTLESIDERFDAAVVDGPLESDPWDRWTLQCVHRVLNINAPAVVVVSPLTSLASAIDVGFLAHASRRVVTYLMRRWKSGFKWPGPVHRRYHLPRLVRKMETLGYTDIKPGSGWPVSERSNASAWFSRRSTVTARKTCSLAGLQGRPWPDAAAHVGEYAKQWAHLFAAREKWLAAFSEFRAVIPRALDPSEWRGARVLVLSPHPDDELIGCGGTLCRILAAGAQAWILQATDGCKLESLRDLPEARRKSVRLEEASRVAGALEAGLVLWRHEDAALQCSSGTIAQLTRLLGELRPTYVFTPFLTDVHDDHRTLSHILGQALAAVDLRPRVLQYEVWSLVPANLYCDITGQAERLESLLLLYTSAMRVVDYVHLVESRNISRALELGGRPAYMEAFLSTTSDEFRYLAERTALDSGLPASQSRSQAPWPEDDVIKPAA